MRLNNSNADIRNSELIFIRRSKYADMRHTFENVSFIGRTATCAKKFLLGWISLWLINFEEGMETNFCFVANRGAAEVDRAIRRNISSHYVKEID